MEWRTQKLGDVLTLKRGYDLPKRDRVPGPFPLVSSSGVTDRIAISKVRGPGVVTGRYGTLGEVFFVEEDFWPLNTSLYVEDFKGNDPKFVSLLLSQLNFGTRNAAGAVPGVNRNHLHVIDVQLPSATTQRRISTVISSYDDLIENNQRRVRILEDMARMIYREWFIDFEFPGFETAQFVTSPIGRVPKGWKVRVVSDAVEINPRVVVPRDGVKPFVPMRSLSTASMLITDIEQRKGNSGSKFQNGDSLLARITPCLENGKTAFVQFLPDDDHVAFGSTEFIVFRSRLLTPEYVYLLARSEFLRAHAIKSMSGATGRQRVQEKCFDSLSIACPGDDLLSQFSDVVRPMFQQIQVLALASAALRQSRDLLLPKLMSGEIDVSRLPPSPDTIES